MTMEGMQDFVAQVETDAQVGRTVEEIGYTNIAALVAYAQELGFAVDAADFDALKQQAVDAGNEISDDELSAVSGGWFFRGGVSGRKF